MAFVVRTPGREVSEASLSAYLATLLSKFKLPRAWMFLDELPRTPYGKVIKDELRRQFLSDTSR